MGVVWLAHDQQLNREVAVRLLRPEVASTPEQRKRFEREAQALASLTHENIVRVYDYAESGDDAFLVMEFINGESPRGSPCRLASRRVGADAELRDPGLSGARIRAPEPIATAVGFAIAMRF